MTGIQSKALSREFSLERTTSLPRWVRGGKGCIPEYVEEGTALWSGATAPPEIGESVTINFNGLGAGKVVGYFVEKGWLGLHVALDHNPEWRRGQFERLGLPADRPASVFGAEIGGAA